MSAGIGSEVGLYMDTSQRLLVGNYIQTPTGRTYEILTVRTQQRGKHEGRQHIRALVVPSEAIDPDATVTPIRWYRR